MEKSKTSGSNRYTCEDCGKTVYVKMNTGLPKGWRQLAHGLFYKTTCGCK